MFACYFAGSTILGGQQTNIAYGQKGRVVDFVISHPNRKIMRLCIAFDKTRFLSWSNRIASRQFTFMIKMIFRAEYIVVSNSMYLRKLPHIVTWPGRHKIYLDRITLEF